MDIRELVKQQMVRRLARDLMLYMQEGAKHKLEKNEKTPPGEKTVKDRKRG